MDISYVGYKTQTINLKAGVREYNVVLHEDTEMLDEVVVVGYGTTRKSDLTGAIAQIDPTKNRSRGTSAATWASVSPPVRRL